ncbi:MAG: ROK family protein [Anaerolineae bacterium]
MLTPLYSRRPRATPRDVRRINRSTVLHDLLTIGAMSRRDLSLRSGLSPATVANVIADLEAEGKVVVVGQDESAGGRPGAIYGLNPGVGYCIGIALSETFATLLLFDGALRSIDHMQVPVAPQDTQPATIVDILSRSIDALLERHGAQRQQLAGIGVAMPGVVDAVHGIAVYAPNWGWHQVAFMDMLRERIRVPIYMDNTLKFYAIAEAWFGAGQATDHMVTVVLGTGVGAGAMVHGTLLRGATNAAGEWGHTTLVYDGRPCRCGNRGCVEAYVGAPGILQTLAELDPASPLLDPLDEVKSLEALAAAARAGDPVAREALAQTTRYLGAAIATLISLLNPEVVILSSWVGYTLGPLIADDLRAEIARHALAEAVAAVRIVVSTLGTRAAALGAATVALEQMLSNPEAAGAQPVLETHGQPLWDGG